MKRMVLLVLTLVALSASTAFAAQLINLGAGISTGMTSDGQVVSYTQEAAAKIWTSQYGAVSLGAGTTAGVARKGSSLVVAGIYGGAASRWDGDAQGTGSWTSLPASSEGYAFSLSQVGSLASDGTAVMFAGSCAYTGTDGKAYYRAARSKDDGTTQWTSLCTLPTTLLYYHDNSTLNGVSETDVVAGRAQRYGTGPSGGGKQTVIGYDGGSSLIPCKNLLGGPTYTNEALALAISGNGSRTVGWSWCDTNATYQACYWNDDPYTLRNIPTAVPFAPGYYYSEATAVSRTGAYIGGAMWLAGDVGQEAFIWDATHGTRLIKDVLAAAGVDTTGWVLSNDYADGAGYYSVSGISEDGMIITGTGTYNGVQSVWVVNLVPEPGSFSILALGLVGLVAARKRKV